MRKNRKKRMNRPGQFRATVITGTISTWGANPARQLERIRAVTGVLRTQTRDLARAVELQDDNHPVHRRHLDPRAVDCLMRQAGDMICVIGAYVLPLLERMGKGEY